MDACLQYLIHVSSRFRAPDVVSAFFFWSACSEVMSVSLSVTQAVLRQYELLPKKGKPNENEYTILAGFVIESGEPECWRQTAAQLEQLELCSHVHAGGAFHTVALGTGSKCVGRSSMSTTGQTLHDSHAEIIACRSFRR
jgi:tRNA-specific adenosine deaminase 1